MAHTQAATKVINGVTTDVTPYCSQDGQVWPCDATCDALGIGPHSYSRPPRFSTISTTIAEGQATGRIGTSTHQERTY